MFSCQALASILLANILSTCRNNGGLPCVCTNMDQLKSEMAKAIELIRLAYSAVAECGKEGMPSGHLYALMMPAFSDLSAYEKMVDLMVRTKMFSKSGNLLIAAKV